MKRAILIAMLLGYGALVSGCAAGIAAGAVGGGAYVYEQHEGNKERRRSHR